MVCGQEGDYNIQGVCFHDQTYESVYLNIHVAYLDLAPDPMSNVLEVVRTGNLTFTLYDTDGDHCRIQGLQGLFSGGDDEVEGDGYVWVEAPCQNGGDHVITGRCDATAQSDAITVRVRDEDLSPTMLLMSKAASSKPKKGGGLRCNSGVRMATPAASSDWTRSIPTMSKSFQWEVATSPLTPYAPSPATCLCGRERH